MKSVLGIGPAGDLVILRLQRIINPPNILVAVVGLELDAMAVNDALQRRLHLHLLQTPPVKTTEKGMLLHLLPGSVPQSFLRMQSQQAVDEALQLVTEFGVLPRSVVLRCQDHLLQSRQIFEFGSGEGGAVVGEFVCEHAQHPQVDLPAVPLVQDHFRRVVGGRASLRPALLSRYLLGQPKIRQLHVPVFEDEHVFWFQVAIHDVLLVQILDPQHQAPQNEPDSGLACLFELLSPFGSIGDKGVGVSALRVLHHKIEILLVPEGVVQDSYKGALRFQKDLSLQLHVAHQLLLVNLELGHSLNCVFLDDALRLVLLELCEEDVSEGTAADAVGYIETAPPYGLPVAVDLLEGLDHLLFILQLFLRFLLLDERSGCPVLGRLALVR